MVLFMPVALDVFLGESMFMIAQVTALPSFFIRP